MLLVSSCYFLIQFTTTAVAQISPTNTAVGTKPITEMDRARTKNSIGQSTNQHNISVAFFIECWAGGIGLPPATLVYVPRWLLSCVSKS